MTTLEETLKHDLIARLTAPTDKTQRAHCMTCGRGLEPAKAAKGGRARFCSGCCMTEAVSRLPATGTDSSKGIVVDDHRGSAWLVRPVSTNAADFGVIVVDLGRPSEVFDELRARVVALIADAGLSLERLGLARTISEARTRAEAEQFREALIGSVSHELRTPLSSILGASTVLSLAPEISGNACLKKLAALIHQESERLNVEIQNILDASRISSNHLQAKLEWAEPADFINAALQRCRNRLVRRAVEVTLPEELTLLRIDSVLMERALGQILDNAAKYSTPESPINVRGHVELGQFAISVTDQGAGLDADDRPSAWTEVLSWESPLPGDFGPRIGILDRQRFCGRQ
jgi:two-component system, OmpR family, sensor histidine kinase KdpD